MRRWKARRPNPAVFDTLDSARLDDAAALFCDVFRAEPWNYAWLTPDAAKRYFRDIGATPGFRGYSAVIGGRMVGACVGCLQDYFAAPDFEIKEIIIARSMQRAGLGGRLLAYTEERLAAEGAVAVTLMTKRDIGAYSFYLKHGYSVLETSAHMGKGILKQ